MTRPAINYNTSIVSGNSYRWFDYQGVYLWQNSSSTTVQETRRCNKPASVKTSPKTGGNYSTPTSYSSSFGRWSVTGNATSYTMNRSPGWIYRCEIDGSVYTSLGFDPQTLYADPSWVEKMLLIRALNKLRDQDVNFGVMLAEASETANLFETTAIRIAKAVTSFRKKNPKAFALARLHQGTATWKKTPQAWLELQYGWNPLMTDLHGAACKLDSNRTRERNYVSVKSKKSLKDTVSYVLDWTPGYGASTCIVGVSADYTVRLCYRLRNFNLALLSSLGLTNPAEIVWERVPYSFVVDWFLPVGSWLSALGGDFGYDFLNGSYTRFRRLTNERTEVHKLPSSYFPLGAPQVHGFGVSLQRTLYASSPWPGLYFKSPVSPGHLANASSLLSQAFSRHSRK